MVPIENSVKIMVFKVQWNRKLLFKLYNFYLKLK